MILEEIKLTARRQTSVLFIPSATSVQVEGDATRCHARLTWVFPAAVEVPPGSVNGDCKLTIKAKNNSGSTINATLASITVFKPVDDIDAQEFGDALTQQMTVINESLVTDAFLITTVWR